MVTPASVQIGMPVRYRSMFGHKLAGTIRGVIYGAPKMKRDNITHVVIQGSYDTAPVERSHDMNVIPLKDVWKVR